MNHFLVAQAAGVIAVIFSLLVYQFDNRRTMLILDLFGNLFWILTFLQLRAMTGLFLVSVGAISNFLFIKFRPDKENLWLLVIVLATIALATAVTWKGPVGLLAMTGSMLYTIRFWTTSTSKIRHMSLIAAPAWLIYDVLTGNYPGVFIEVFGVGSNLMGQYRFEIKAGSKER